MVHSNGVKPKSLENSLRAGLRWTKETAKPGKIQIRANAPPHLAGPFEVALASF